MYVRLVEKREDGIVVRGAKAHQTGIINSHELLVMPTTFMDEEDQAYAVAFALPVDTPGVLHIFGRQTNDVRRLDGQIDQGNAKYGVVGQHMLLFLEGPCYDDQQKDKCQ